MPRCGIARQRPSCEAKRGGIRLLSDFRRHGAMSDKDQMDHFCDDLDRLVNRYRSEYEMSYAAIVGVLQMKIHRLCDEASERGDEV